MKKETVFIKSLINTFIALIVCFNFFSCSNEIEESGIKSKVDDVAKYDEKNYSFKTIDLWGSEAAVVDAGDYYIFQGDIHIDKKDVDKPVTKGAGVLNRRWPNNIVYYTLSGSPSNTQPLFEAMTHIEQRSYLTFKPRLENEKNYIKINYINSDEWKASSDYIGMKGGEQNLKISKASWSRGTIIHELCHALGMYHEQCRSDRDQFVRIDFSGMSSDDRHQYKTYIERGENGRDFGNYDFSSIMHYSSWLGDREVMWRLDGSLIYANRDHLSEGDIATLASLQSGTIGYGTFYDPLGYNQPYDGDYECRRSKFLRFPEGGDIAFRFQYKYNPSSSTLGEYSIGDFNMNVIVSILNNDTNREVYTRTIPLSQTSSYIDINIPQINIRSGLYTTRVRLVGSVNGISNSSKLSVLRRLMFNPMVYLHLSSFKVNGNSLTIPSTYSYDATLRRLTFISIE